MAVYNFSPGPAVIFPQVLEQLQRELVNYKNSGYSLIEASHRGKLYETVHEKTVSLMKALLGVGDDYDVLLLGGGATLQFAMLPYNFLTKEKPARYIITGSWGKKALSDAKKLAHFGAAEAFDAGKDKVYTRIPGAQELAPVLSADSAYVHITTNETIDGVQWQEDPASASPLVADASSDILSRPINTRAYSLIYAGAQKNIGPAGVTVVVVKKDFLSRAANEAPSYLSYKTHADSNSLYNTPPVFAIWAVGLVLEHIQTLGGLSAMERINRDKAALLYKAIDGSKGFYRCPADAACRSAMNVVFRLPSEELEAEFVSEATKAQLLGLKGHRSVGGCRASIYNAMPHEGVQSLVSFMDDFCKRRG